ncbi:MAG: ribonuclease HI family protein [Thermomicrobiales bacterium]
MSQRSRNGIDTKQLLRVDPTTLSRDQLVEFATRLQQALGGSPPAPVAPPAPARKAAVPPAQASAAKAATLGHYTVIFDGGSKGNPGLGYGSYEVDGPQGVEAANRMEFGHNMTNNQAEFLALIAGLQRVIELTGNQPQTARVSIRGDSQLVIKGLKGEWKIKHPNVQPLHREASDLLRRFGAVDLAWHPRRESVKAFGH